MKRPPRVVAFIVGVGLLATGCSSSPPRPLTAASPAAILPDPAFTPGATNPAVTPANIGRTICVRGWTAIARPPESYTERVKELEAAGGGTVVYAGVSYVVHGFGLADRDLSHYELDHLIPLELGGSPADPRNLWLEPHEAPRGAAPQVAGSEAKDRVENAARAAVCNGRLGLVAAQRAVVRSWHELGRQLGGP